MNTNVPSSADSAPLITDEEWVEIIQNMLPELDKAMAEVRAGGYLSESVNIDGYAFKS